MKFNTLLGFSFALLFSNPSFVNAQSSQETIVKNFGDYMSSWCKTKDFSYLEKIEKLVEGSKACRVDDGLSQIFVKNDKSGLISEGTMVMDKYLNYMDQAISENVTYSHGTPIWQKDYTEPTAYNDKTEIPLKFVSMDIETKGSINFSGADLFFVRGEQITKIVDFNDDNSIAKAIQLYSEHKYEDAFKLFRKLAYEDPNNYDAQYYTAVMEIKKQGCGFLNSKVRDIEAAWWVSRGVVGNALEKDWSKERMAKLYTRFDIDERPLPFNNRGKEFYRHSLMIRKLCNNGLMAYKNSKGLYGFMNEDGKLVVPCTYNLVFPFDKNGLALVQKDGKVGYIDTSGNIVIPIKYNSALFQFKDGISYVILDENLLQIDEKGNVLKEVGKGYDNLYPEFVGGKAYAHHKTANLFYLHDTQGNITSVEKEGYYVDYKKQCYFTQDATGKRLYEEPIVWK